jgi:tetratricopeptide (TPR) repeat protein
MSWIVVVLILAGFVAAGFLLWPRWSSLLTSKPSTPNTAEPPASTPKTERRRWVLQRIGRIPAFLALAIIGLLLISFAVGALFTNNEQFVVVVAPFRDINGNVTQTGQSAADELVTLLEADNFRRLVIHRVADAPTSLEAAREVLTQQRGDVLVWGSIAPGAMFDQEALLPQLTYIPTGAYAPFAWDGFRSRFAIPTDYQLALAPINGRVILPRLLHALEDYSSGRFDASSQTLSDLLTTYPALHESLPRSLRGNMLWARGEYQNAAAEYRRIPELTTPSDATSMAPYYANNLGAILYDAQDPAARDAFNQAIMLLGSQRDMGELRLNLGLEELRAGRAIEALAMLEQAKNLLPESTTVQLALARAYRETGPAQFDRARTALDESVALMNREAGLVGRGYSESVEMRYRAQTLIERSMQSLARATNARGSLWWEVWSRESPDVALLTDAARDVELSLQQSDELIKEWQRRSVADDASEAPVNGLISLGQARRAAERRDTNQLWQETIELRLIEARGIRSPDGLTGLWTALFGDRSQLTQQRERLETRLRADANQIEALLLLGRNNQLAQRLPDAERWYNAALSADPTRAEAKFGLALLQLPGNTAEAQRLLAEAIQIQPLFFPAREELAKLAEQERNWLVALEQWRWLSLNRPTNDVIVNLARVLRMREGTALPEAERLLLPLANANHVPALLELAAVYRASGNNPSAQRALIKAQKVAPENSDVAVQLGDLLKEQESFAEAEQQYKLALYYNPNLIQAHLGLAEIYNSDRKELATESFRAALDVGSEDPMILQRIGKELLDRGQNQSAAEAYDRLIKLTPNDPDAHYWLSQGALRAGEIDRARRAAQKAVELRNGVFPPAFVALGDCDLLQGKLPEAITNYNMALAQDGNLTLAKLGLGRVAAAEGKWAVAIAQFQQASAVDTNNPEAHYWLGKAFSELRDPRAAITAFQQALSLNSRYTEARYELARAQFSLQQFNEAQANLRQVLVQRPDYADALLLDGKIAEELGNFQNADRLYTRAINANAKSADAFYRRGLLALRDNRIAAARADFVSAVAVQPIFPEARYWLGRAYLVDGRAREAFDELQKAIAQRGDRYPEARYYQGVAEEQLGRPSDAVTSYRAALEQDPTGLWASEARAALTRLGVP